jgi:hypothetical protein
VTTADLTWLDLCSGLGGASQPALDRGWRVIRVDIDRRFKPDIVADVRNLPLKPFHVDVLWASPPCTEFTKSVLPKTWASTWKNPPKPDPELTAACLAAIHAIKPRWWVIENVMGARRYLSPILGPVRAMVTGHVFWGVLPCLLPQTKSHKWRLPPTPDRTALRAKIPTEIGEAICRAVEQRHDIFLPANAALAPMDACLSKSANEV